MIRAGVDVGGTFTDVILECVKDSGSREIVVTKVSSTPENQSIGVVKGVLQACQMAGVSPGEIDILYHGTTVATNMVIERSGARVGMITTKGFR
ncbi:MAG: hydantoinase/oxoprolinase N-terminal domain-containing protein, partial [Rhizobiaceae bacterium]|nr:hydantoinase/oxoprolinase N-terminal domain-containing protein [Rhizobiaceae bacterium]